MSSERREAMTGYLMVLPTILLIFVVALFPVLRTFWLSTFDLRLNNARLSQTYLSHQLDLEYYADSYFRLGNSLKKLARDENPEIAGEATRLREQVQERHSAFLEAEGLTAAYDTVYEMVLNMEAVTDAELRYHKISGDSYGDIKAFYEETGRSLQALAAGHDSQNAKMAAQIAEDATSSFREPNMVGLGNYAVLLKDARLGSALLNTVLFAVPAVFFELCLGILVALIMNKPFRGRGVLRASVLVPWSIPAAVSALMWRFMYDGQYGIVSGLFTSLGLISDPSVILTTKWGAMFGLVFADVWKTTPFMALTLLSGLQVIDEGLYEASTIDGASKLQQFTRITLPLLKPTILVALLFRTLDTFKVFDLVSVLTNGGPANGTETISVFAYKTMFANMNFGMGSAIAVLLFLLLAVVCMIYIKVLGADLIKVD